ncbi:hypothetical protein MG293_010307 [Ovis ammon polii]|uniref:Uncharacterized protein n=1 Tax=Ovis ammon polii TaxID=230172 RepID=A0AAD4U4T9_OVIAM|nr:hypothetical protein MG293_010307 [Ovis ammon polii]
MKSLARLSPGLRQDKGGQCGNSAHTWSQEARCGGQAQPSPPRCLEHQLWASCRQTLCTHTAVLGFIDKDVGAQRGFLHWLTPGLIEGLPRCALPRVGCIWVCLLHPGRRCLPLTSLGFMERPSGGSPEYCRAQHLHRAHC